MIILLKAPPFATIQDRGWRVGRAMGLPEGGAMDRRGLERANALAENPPGAAVIEWALGTGSLRFETTAVVGLDGWGEVRLDGTTVPGDTGTRRLVVEAGNTLMLTPDPRWRFMYVAVRGGIDVPEVMGSRSTYLPGGFGGHEGRRLRSGDRLPVGERRPSGRATRVSVPALERPGSEVLLPVTRGPQWGHFDEPARHAFFSAQYGLSTASDRMGYRLSGPAIRPRAAATLPSEAACPGAVQIPDGGEPIVLMPDGPTVGGYPKLAVVRRGALGRLAQCVPGTGVRFRLDE